MEKIIKIAVQAKETIPYNQLEPFQGELKTLSKEQYERMRSNILKYGFSFAVHVWKHEGHNYIIDGHQRMFTVKHLAEVEHYDVPEIPIAIVEAATFQEAKQKILAGASQYGEVKEEALYQFLIENEIPFEMAAANFNFMEIDYQHFAENFFDIEGQEIPIYDKDDAEKSMQSSSDGVKMIQLFFAREMYEDFSNKIQQLANLYGTENITDTVMKAVDAAYTIKNKGQ